MKEEFNTLIKLTGLFYDTYSPGDGCTRYKFNTESFDYFSITAHICKGIREACIYLTGYLAAIDNYKIMERKG